MFSWLINLIKKLFGKPAVVSAPATLPSSGGNIVGEKYALLVGINKYAEPGNDLSGCVNDVTDMAELLSTQFGFKPDNIRILTDNRATQANILERLSWLVTVAKPGDQLVWHYSGHGSQVRDRDGDELEDQLDEIICPHDLDWDNPFTDDLIASYFKEVIDGATLTFISDSCHSGTIDKGLSQNPHPKKSKFLRPPPDIEWRSKNRELPLKALGKKGLRVRSAGDVHTLDQRNILFSGCRDEQTSADAYFGGRYNGALTYYLIRDMKAINGSWKAIHSKVLDDLRSGGYDQVPQLSGSGGNLDGKPFGS
jgi:hypothetical protein